MSSPGSNLPSSPRGRSNSSALQFVTPLRTSVLTTKDSPTSSTPSTTTQPVIFTQTHHFDHINSSPSLYYAHEDLADFDDVNGHDDFIVYGDLDHTDGSYVNVHHKENDSLGGVELNNEDATNSSSSLLQEDELLRYGDFISLQATDLSSGGGLGFLSIEGINMNENVDG